MARCVDDSLYTGIAKDVDARLAAHNAGRGAAYTRARRPVRLVYKEKGFTLSKALSREATIKSLARPDKLALMKAAGRAALAALLLVAVAARARAVPTFGLESGVAFASATPQGVTYSAPAASFTYPIRLFFIRRDQGVEVGSASSPDGVTFTEDAAGGRVSTNTTPSVSASSITGCDVMPITGGFRMVYSITSSTGAYRIVSATSTDGLNWANDTGTRIDNGATYLSSPKLVTLNDGSWRMYYTANSDGGTDVANRWIYTSRSTNKGLAWSAPAVAVATMAYSVGASALTNGFVRLYYTVPLTGSSTATVVQSALSNDVLGTSFALESGFRISTSAASGALDGPALARSTDTFRWRMYYGYFNLGQSTGDVDSALTGAPAPASLSPSSALNTQSTTTFTISGDVFSGPPTATAPTVQLSGTGATLLPSSVLRNSDQSLTAVFDVQGLTPQFYTLTVTNSDGDFTTLPNALNVGFPPGSVSLINNLLRPRTGTTTAITISTFNPGQVLARLFTSDGRSVRTLLDAPEPAGQFTLTWNGTDAGGAPVASGLYLLHVTGPNLNTRAKIIVIR
jgi:putative endonuclease